MFNPLVNNLSSLTDQQLEQKISEITRKYVMIRNSGNQSVVWQLAGVLDIYKQELLNRTYAKQKEAEKQKNPDLDPFASLDIN
jgi:hypothetical protein